MASIKVLSMPGSLTSWHSSQNYLCALKFIEFLTKSKLRWYTLKWYKLKLLVTQFFSDVFKLR